MQRRLFHPCNSVGLTMRMEAGELMIGSQGTSCALQLLRVQPAVQGQGPEQVKLTEIAVTVPRTLKVKSLYRSSRAFFLFII